MSVDADFKSEEGEEEETQNFLTKCLFSVEKAQ